MGGKRVKDEEKTKKQKEREHSKRGKEKFLTSPYNKTSFLQSSFVFYFFCSF